jgi:hypothetical protein
MNSEWTAFIAAGWLGLASGGRACAPRTLPHPAVSGFSRPRVTEDRGQSVDWVASLADGSRIHAHEYPDGSIVVHRDATVPSQGPVAAVWHVATETRFGGLILKAAAIALGVYVGGQLGAYLGGAT